MNRRRILMSSPPSLRRKDKEMQEARALDAIARGFVGRIATVGPDGWPYCVPFLYVWSGGELLLHNSASRGHFRTNVDNDERVCFELDEAGDVFNYGRFQCDTSVAFCSVIVFGTIKVIEDEGAKTRFFDALMAKYGKPGSGRPEHFYPRIGEITLYAIKPERITGKETPLPDAAQQWPATDRTKSPHARL
jgi:nitroimidazol reductase NimA-like FMN-containing flavoprotein (pyridoxamine 5'-phosphate oxidase superfamily)